MLLVIANIVFSFIIVPCCCIFFRFALTHNHTHFRPRLPLVRFLNSAGKSARFFKCQPASRNPYDFLFDFSFSGELKRDCGRREKGRCLHPRSGQQSVWTVSAGLKQRARFCSYLNSSPSLSRPLFPSLYLSLAHSRVQIPAFPEHFFESSKLLQKPKGLAQMAKYFHCFYCFAAILLF